MASRFFGDTMPVMFNADHANTIAFTFPKPENGDPWELIFDTARPARPEDSGAWTAPQYDLEPCSVVVFRSQVPRPEEGL